MTKIDIDSASDHIWMYYGNSSAANVQTSSDTYDSNYAGIWHLNETSGTHFDATTNSNDGTPLGDIDRDATGKVDGGDDFDGNGDYIVVPDAVSLKPAQITIEAWVKPISYMNWASVAMKATDDTWEDGYGLAHYWGTNDINFYVKEYDKNWITATLVTGNWSHVAGTYDGSTIRLFVNGQQVDSKPCNVVIPHSNNDLWIGNGQGNGPYFWSGSIDEVRISKLARDPAWIYAQYLSMNNEFITFSSEENNFGGSAYIFFGDGTIPSTAGNADIAFANKTICSKFGYSVSSAGDINNDGYDEVIIGAPGIDKAFILNWTESSIVLTGVSSSAFGWSVADLGDIDQDGSFDDVIVGAPGYSSNTGRAYIFLGNDRMNSSIDFTDANITLTGESTGDRFGYSVSNAGDINGDGAVDVIVGAPYYDNNLLIDAGAIYVFYGGPTISTTAFWLHKGGTTGEHFGWSVSLAGRLDIDLNQDVVVGAPHYNDNLEIDTGKAIVLTKDPNIPEYDSLAIPVLIILLLFMIARKRRESSLKSNVKNNGKCKRKKGVST